MDLTQKTQHLSTNQLLAAVADGVSIFDLSRPMELGMAQSPNHPQFRLSMPRRHGDMVRVDGGSAANDLLVTGTHVGTHIDALGHVSQCGELYGGADALQTQTGGRLMSHGVEEIPLLVRRGVLLDIAGLHNVECLEGGYEITPEHLDAAAEAAGVSVQPGDVVLIRSGWGRWWSDSTRYVGVASGVPGVGEAGARWLAQRQPIAAGADTIAFECLHPNAGHAVLPAHRVLLVESGIFIIEALALDELAQAQIHEFLFVLTPLHLVGATGSPVRPIAVVGA